jgi:hypothetical protein
MSNPDRLGAELQSITNQIVHARNALGKGEVADLSSFEGRVSRLCEDLRQLPAAESEGLKSALLAMIEELNGLEGALKDGLAHVKSQIGEATERQRALQAYGQRKP